MIPDENTTIAWMHHFGLDGISKDPQFASYKAFNLKSEHLRLLNTTQPTPKRGERSETQVTAPISTNSIHTQK